MTINKYSCKWVHSVSLVWRFKSHVASVALRNRDAGLHGSSSVFISFKVTDSMWIFNLSIYFGIAVVKYFNEVDFVSSARKNSQRLAGNFSNDRNASTLLQNPHADTNDLLKVRAKMWKNVSHPQEFWPFFALFWPRCADHLSKFGARNSLKVPEHVSSFWAMVSVSFCCLKMSFWGKPLLKLQVHVNVTPIFAHICCHNHFLEKKEIFCYLMI